MVVFTVDAFDEIGSTNTEAIKRARAGAPEGLVITAKRQGAGRGRQGRSWKSPIGNLYASFLLRPQGSITDRGQISFIAALAVGETLGLYGLTWQLKWPNDVLINGAKISGLLLESEEDWVVLGIGINVSHTPEVEGRRVTSVLEQGGTASVDDILTALQFRLGEWYARWQRDGFAPVRQAWLLSAYGLGQPIRVVLSQGQEVTGIFETLDTDGALLLKTGTNEIQRILAGDVFFR